MLAGKPGNVVYGDHVTPVAVDDTPSSGCLGTLGPILQTNATAHKPYGVIDTALRRVTVTKCRCYGHRLVRAPLIRGKGQLHLITAT